MPTDNSYLTSPHRGGRQDVCHVLSHVSGLTIHRPESPIAITTAEDETVSTENENQQENDKPSSHNSGEGDNNTKSLSHLSSTFDVRTPGVPSSNGNEKCYRLPLLRNHPLATKFHNNNHESSLRKMDNWFPFDDCCVRNAPRLPTSPELSNETSKPKQLPPPYFSPVGRMGGMVSVIVHSTATTTATTHSADSTAVDATTTAAISTPLLQTVTNESLKSINANADTLRVCVVQQQPPQLQQRTLRELSSVSLSNGRIKFVGVEEGTIVPPTIPLMATPDQKQRKISLPTQLEHKFYNILLSANHQEHEKKGQHSNTTTCSSAVVPQTELSSQSGGGVKLLFPQSVPLKIRRKKRGPSSGFDFLS